MTGRTSRTVAEWTSFAVCCLVVLTVIALLGVQLVGEEKSAAPMARQLGAVREAAGHFYVRVEVTNDGDITASDVQVLAELTIGDEVTDGEQSIAFLAGGETDEVVFAFDDDPRQGELVVRVGGYGEP